MKTKNRKRFEASFKARVALLAAQEQESLAEIGRRFGIHPVVVGQWKKQLTREAAKIFAKGGEPDTEKMREELLIKIGELTVERDFLARGLRRSR
jgi:transposase